MKHVAVVGASGAVGERMIRLLEDRDFPVASIKFLASERSAGKSVLFRGESHSIERSRADAFAASRSSCRARPQASRGMEPDRGGRRGGGRRQFERLPDGARRPARGPRGEPPGHPQAPRDHRQSELFDHPDGGCPQAAPRRGPRASRRRQHVSVGLRGRDERDPRARAQTEAHVRGAARPAPAKFAHPIFGNCIPHIDDFLPNGYTKEEIKMVNETRKIMGDPTIDVSPTCVRVPVAFSHSESILVETERPVSVEEALALWAVAPGVTVVDDPMTKHIPAGRRCRRQG